MCNCRKKPKPLKGLNTQFNSFSAKAVKASAFIRAVYYNPQQTVPHQVFSGEDTSIATGIFLGNLQHGSYVNIPESLLHTTSRSDGSTFVLDYEFIPPQILALGQAVLEQYNNENLS